MTEAALDARRLLCPLPVIRVQQRIAYLQVGDTLRVEFTDPGALLDIPAWCRIHGHEVLKSCDSEGASYVLIKVQGQNETSKSDQT